MADIVLINPRFEMSYWGMEHALQLCAKLGKRANMPVSALPLLAALTPAEHKITLIDENVEDIDFALCAKADIVGVTGMTVQRFRTTEILKELKGRGCFTVAGGPWVSVKEDYFGALADVIFVGEAEETWPQFLADWAQGKHASRYEQAERTDMSKVPPPRYDLLKMDRYLIAPVQFSRGCPFTCEFCDIIVTFGRRPRLKTAPQIIAELEAIHRIGGVGGVFIVDDNLIGNKKAVKQILREVITWQKSHDYPVTFFAESSLDLADDEELMSLMDDANIRYVFIGIETPNEESLRETRKLQNLRGSNRSIVEKVHAIQAQGLEVWTGMIVGFDNDGPDIFERQIRFVEEARVIHTSVGMLTAIPKTPLYERLANENRLDTADRTPYGTNVIPLGMDRDTLREGYLRVLHALYEPKAYFARVDAVFLGAGLRLQTGAARHKHLRSRPLSWLIQYAEALVNVGFVFFKLQTAAVSADLRRHYRRVFFNAVRHRPEPFVLQAYALKAILHYHYHKLIEAIDDEGHLLNIF
jgi:radical SAM superfamily enzyme YgiQ (UPF0313 family)